MSQCRVVLQCQSSAVEVSIVKSIGEAMKHLKA